MSEKNEAGRVEREFLSFGGPYGKSPEDFQDGNGVDLSEWIPNLPLVQQNVIVVVTRYFGESMQDHETSNQAAQALLEIYPVKIVGLRTGVRFIRHQMRDAGIERLQVEPEITYSEKYGGPIYTYYEQWLLELAERYKAFANAQHANLTDSVSYLEKIREASLDVLFLEPDPTRTVILKAWHCRNFHPITVTGPEGQRDISAGQRYGTVVVQFRAETEISEAVDKEALAVLEKINTASANPYEHAKAVDKIHDEVTKKPE